MKRLIRFVACLYPASWRARYGVEFEALLEDLDPNWRTFLDTLKGGLEMQVSTWNIGKLLAATGIAGILIGLGLSLTVPRQYASTATIGIVFPPPRDVPATDESVANYVNSSAYRAMSQSSLTKIIEDFGLYGSQRTKTPSEDVIDQMKRTITVRPKHPGAGAKTAFTIQFVYSDPVLSQRVTEELTSRFMEENVREAISGKRSMTFEITHAPSLSRNPFSPNQWKISTAGLVIGICIGLLAAIFRRPYQAASAHPAHQPHDGTYH